MVIGFISLAEEKPENPEKPGVDGAKLDLAFSFSKVFDKSLIEIVKSYFSDIQPFFIDHPIQKNSLQN